MAPVSTTYKLEVWGAQGGNTNGGNGGYSYGNKTIDNGNTLYVCVGGQGVIHSGSTGGFGGYNGGGNGGNAIKPYVGGCGGGGATHIAIKTSGTLYTVLNNSSTKSNVLIVGGGGGGGLVWAQDYIFGGTGGGISGGNSLNTFPKPSDGREDCPISSGGSSSNYFSLGKGQDGVTSTPGPHGGEGNGGGGGGYYAGFSNQKTGYASNACGGGGSGYIGGVTNGATTAGVQTGNGRAIISWHPNI